jgi:hypothetical protein
MVNGRGLSPVLINFQGIEKYARQGGKLSSLLGAASYACLGSVLLHT